MKQLAAIGAVIYAKDLPRVASFYQELLAMSVVQAEADHIVLESAACQLVVHAIPPHIARQIVLSEPPVLREDTPFKLLFLVDSLAAARARAPLFGGGLQPASSEFEALGYRACDGHDPEGNVLQLREALG